MNRLGYHRWLLGVLLSVLSSLCTAGDGVYPITFTQRGSLGITQSACSAGVFVEFKGNRLLTDLGRAAYRERGCLLVASEEQAKAAVRFGGIYTVEGTGLKEVTLPLGNFVQQAGEQFKPEAGQDLATISTGDAVVAQGTLVTAYAIGAVALPVTLAEFLQILTKQVGIGGAFNKLVSGHKDGFCAHDCERRDWADQKVIFYAKYEEGGRTERTEIVARQRSPEVAPPGEIITETFLYAAKVNP